MEEKKATATVAPAEITKEQCLEFISALKSQNAQLIHQLQNASMINMFKRLDYLFKIIENATMFDEAFVDQCVEEIKELMTLPSEEEKAED